jgi:hypothetical protein
LLWDMLCLSDRDGGMAGFYCKRIRISKRLYLV